MGWWEQMMIGWGRGRTIFRGSKKGDNKLHCKCCNNNNNNKHKNKNKHKHKNATKRCVVRWLQAPL